MSGPGPLLRAPTVQHWKKCPCYSTENVQKMEYGEGTEYRVSVHILCGAYMALYKIPRKTGTELPSSLEYGMSGQIVDQKCSVLFLCLSLAAR